MKSMMYNLGLVSKYRSALMGMATIGILMCHAPANGVNLPFHLNSVLGLGQMGVMIFFFVSGLGLYYSTHRMEYSACGIAAWYRKRFVRLFVPYLIIYAPVLYISMSDGISLNWGGICWISQPFHTGLTRRAAGLWTYWCRYTCSHLYGIDCWRKLPTL